MCRRHAEAGIRNQKKEMTTNGALWLVKLVSFSRWRTWSTRFRTTNKLQLRLLSSRWLFRSRSKLGRVRVDLQFLTSQIFVKIYFCGELPTFLLTLWCWHKKKNKYSPNENVVLIASFFVWLSFFSFFLLFLSSLFLSSTKVFLFIV